MTVIRKLSDYRSIRISSVDGRVLMVKANSAYINLKKNYKGEIQEICYEDKETISVGDVIIINNMSYKIRMIELMTEIEQTYLLFTHKRTLSSYFLLPVLGKNREYFFWGKYIVNCYLHKSGTTREKLKFIYLLYKFSSDPEFEELEKNIKKHPMYINFSNPDKHHIMFIFRIPEEFQNSVIYFLRGKYSEYPDILKKMILTFHGFDRKGRTYQILYKDAKLKQKLEKEYDVSIPENQDLYDRASWKDETYKDSLKD